MAIVRNPVVSVAPSAPPATSTTPGIAAEKPAPSASSAPAHPETLSAEHGHPRARRCTQE